jgi:hypothetical protein
MTVPWPPRSVWPSPSTCGAKPRGRRREPEADGWGYPVHPGAAKLPMMSDAELDELAADIKANGLQEPIILFRDNREERNGGEGPFPIYLLDGRNRIAVLQRLGITDPNRAPGGQIVSSRVHILDALTEGFTLSGNRRSPPTWTPNVDPEKFVRSLNVYRRHLASEQKRDAIAAYLKIDPTASDRSIGRNRPARLGHLGIDASWLSRRRSRDA